MISIFDLTDDIILDVHDEAMDVDDVERVNLCNVALGSPLAANIMNVADIAAAMNGARKAICDHLNSINALTAAQAKEIFKLFGAEIDYDQAFDLSYTVKRDVAMALYEHYKYCAPSDNDDNIPAFDE